MATKTQEPEACYIMLVKGYVNGIILPGFENAEIYPGEPVKVRGADGINFDHAVKLVLNQGFVWCNKDGGQLDVADFPKPTPEEEEILKKTGASMPPGGPVGYPDYHKIDSGDYKGPQVVNDKGKDTGEVAELPIVPMPSLPVTRQSGRRGPMGDETVLPVPTVTPDGKVEALSSDVVATRTPTQASATTDATAPAVPDTKTPAPVSDASATTASGSTPKDAPATATTTDGKTT